MTAGATAGLIKPLVLLASHIVRCVAFITAKSPIPKTSQFANSRKRLGNMKLKDLQSSLNTWLWRSTIGTRIFTARTLMRLSARLARFAVWIAPELIERGTR